MSVTFTTNQKLRLTVRLVDASTTNRLGGKVNWTQDDKGKFVRLSPADPPAKPGEPAAVDVFPLTVGTVRITATEQESGKSDSIDLIVASGEVTQVVIENGGLTPYAQSAADKAAADKAAAKAAKDAEDAEKLAAKQAEEAKPKPLVTETPLPKASPTK